MHLNILSGLFALCFLCIVASFLLFYIDIHYYLANLKGLMFRLVQFIDLILCSVLLHRASLFDFSASLCYFKTLPVLASTASH